MWASIIITSYNYEKYIESCIISCINQRNFSDYEVIIVDDGSTDKTLEIVQKYSPYIRIFVNRNKGVEFTSNYGIKQAKGDYIVRVDADDKLNEDYLRNTVRLIENSESGLAFVYPEYYIIDEDDKIIKQVELPEFDLDEIEERGDFLATGTMYKKEIINRLGFFSEKTKNCGLENYELILKIIHNNFKGKCLHKPLFYYRRHNTNLSIEKRQSINNYGKALAISFGLKCYRTNENHPWV